MNHVKKFVNLVCPLCGNDMLSSNADSISTDAESITYRCAECKSEYSHEELCRGNTEMLENAVKEGLDEVLADFEKQWKKAMKKWSK